jgi:hypothetical protein
MVMHIKKFKVTVVPDRKMNGYEGMNYFAAKTMDFHPCPKKNEVFVSNRYDGNYKEIVVKHEKIEANHMFNGDSYMQGHKKALKDQYKKYPRWMK